MDDLLRDFLTETGEHIEAVDLELVRFERDPEDQAILRNILRLVHTVKGTCGFLGLPRLEALAHAAESLMGRLRDGMTPTVEAVTLILATIDRLKVILAELDRSGQEPDGGDQDLIAELDRLASGRAPEPARAEAPPPAEPSGEEPDPDAVAAAPPGAFAPASAVGQKSQTIRVGIDTLERLMTTVSELVLTRNQLLDLARKSERDHVFTGPLQRLSQVTAELQDGIMKTRMQPIGSAWAKLPRLVRDLSTELGKPIDLVMSGSETELDRQLLEIIRDPLLHMVRNSADHGIESPELRRAAGKPARGTIRLGASHEGGTITVEVADDGRGLDHAAIRRRAAELRLAGEAEIARLSDGEVAHFIFHPGFSTSRAVSSVSGRGVGMDVVKSNVDAIGGTIEVASEAGRGTTFRVKIPLTLAIVAALVIEAGGERFALPQLAVLEVVRPRAGGETSLERIDQASVLRLRDQLLPVVALTSVLELGAAPAGDPDGLVVVLEVGRLRFGLQVDSVLETEEIVVKPISSRLRHIPFFSGNTVLGDGAVVLILDPNGLARGLGSERLLSAFDLGAAADEPAAELDDGLALLVFRGQDQAPKAVPLSLVARLEEVDAGLIERVGGRPVIQYRGALLPVVGLDGEERIRREGLQPLIVFSDGENQLGLAVDEIVDVVEVAARIDPVAARHDVIGSSVVRGRATEIVDLAAFLPWAERPGRARGGAGGRRAPLLLLVDDNAFFRDMLRPVLKAAGYRVVAAATAEEALGILRGGEVAALVADLDLPGRSGLDLVAEMRRIPGCRDAAAILLSSAADDDVLDRARELDVHDVVTKLDRTGLLAALAEAGRALEAA